ncbi:unnamed protein product [Peronospora farinosa]|uniref:Cation efflux protein transmembrane domain-containing protein n=1 Tax=Peronospora farinosa TaxID=134698 RepID=A0AAV0T9P8_9STRA|nr:unnamed protein product [Peronospora farinosa]
MLSEAIHSLVDTGNQAILILGLKQASGVPDKKHQYGYVLAAYFWSLISALGIFWLGSGVTVVHGIYIDGWVSTETTGHQTQKHVVLSAREADERPVYDGCLLEDLSACVGVIIAGCGIGDSQITGNTLWDSLASVSIGVLLGGVAVSLICLNQKYLLGQSVEPEIENGIRESLLARPSIDNVYAVQSQWVGLSTFSFKAEVDFDGTYLAARLLRMYKPVFLESKDLENDLSLILSWRQQLLSAGKRRVRRHGRAQEQHFRCKKRHHVHLLRQRAQQMLLKSRRRRQHFSVCGVVIGAHRTGRAMADSDWELRLL